MHSKTTILSSQELKLKKSMNNEFFTAYREFVESKFSIYLLKANKFASVKNLSSIILEMILSNQDIILEEIEKNPKIIDELRSPYFGSCFEKDKKITGSECYSTIVSVLKNKNSALEKVMQIHSIFQYRIYPKIRKNTPSEREKKIIDKIGRSILFSASGRGRKEHRKTPCATSEMGVCHNSFFRKKMNLSKYDYVSGKDLVSLDKKSQFFQSAHNKMLPIACGPSKHTASLLLGATVYGSFDQQLLEEYVLAIFAFLAAGGHHTWHEIMLVANLFDLPFKDDSYKTSFTSFFQSIPSYKEFYNECPDWIEIDTPKPSI